MNNCLIIGGTRGVGFQTELLLAKDGWNTVPLGRSHIDMNSLTSVDAWLKESTYSHISFDAIVFSHGEWYSRALINQVANHYQTQYNSRVIHPLKIIGHFATQLKMSSVGCVVVVSSTRGFIGGVETGPYSLACAAQIAMVQGFAREYQGIRFGVVCPGLTNTLLGAEVVKTGGAKLGAPMNDPAVVAREIVKLINGEDNGKVIRVVDNKATEAKWSW